MNHIEDSALDEFLVMRCQAGDQTALSALITKWQPSFIRYASVTTRDVTLAKDVVQEAWIKIIRGLPRLQSPTKFPAWAYRIVSNQCMDALRAGKPPEPWRELPDGSQMKNMEARDQVNFTLGQLSADHRSVLALHYLMGFGVEEIAGIIRKPVGTVKSRLFNARDRFREILEQQESETAGENNEHTGQQDTGSTGVGYRPA